MIAYAGAAVRKRKAFNPKRTICIHRDPAELHRIAARVGYGGNPEHKINPGDFGLTPPAVPIADKTKCDGAAIFTRSEALRLIKAGVMKGLVSEQMRGDFPQNIWSVSDRGVPLEAQLENVEKGVYHGYPMPSTDPFRAVVLARWRNA